MDLVITQCRGLRGSQVINSITVSPQGRRGTLFHSLIEAHLLFKITSQTCRQEGKETMEMDFEIYTFKNWGHANKI